MTRNKEIRKLHQSEINEIVNRLSQNSIEPGWKKVIGQIPSAKYPNRKRFTSDIINSAENHIKSNNSGFPSVMHLFLDEWGTMGKTRFPTVKDLLKVCIEVEELYTASFINESILKEGTLLYKYT